MTPIRLRVREFRETCGLSQRELARRAGITQATVSSIERRKSKGIDFDTLEKLARVLDVDPALFIMHESAPAKARATRT